MTLFETSWGDHKGSSWLDFSSRGPKQEHSKRRLGQQIKSLDHSLPGLWLPGPDNEDGKKEAQPRELMPPSSLCTVWQLTWLPVASAFPGDNKQCFELSMDLVQISAPPLKRYWARFSVALGFLAK